MEEIAKNDGGHYLGKVRNELIHIHGCCGRLYTVRMHIVQPEWLDLAVMLTTSRLGILVGRRDVGHTIIIPPLATSSLFVCTRSSLNTTHSSCIGNLFSSSCCWDWRNVSVKDVMLACFVASSLMISLMISSCFAKYECTFRWAILIELSAGKLITFGIGSLGGLCVDSLFISFTLTLMFVD